MSLDIPSLARLPALMGAALVLAAGGPALDQRIVPRQQAMPGVAPAPEPAPAPALPAAVAPPAVVAAPALSGLSPADRARALADARRWSGTIFVGSSVADGKLRDLVVEPWTGSWGDDTVLGGAVQYRVARFWHFFMIDLEAGSIYRFGDTEGGEFWAAAYLRYDGFPWTDHVYTTIGFSMGPNYATRLPRVERGPDRRPERNQSHFLNYFSPEITLALPDYPQYEIAMRYMHRSGIFGTYNGVHEGANTFVLGFRYRF